MDGEAELWGGQGISTRTRRIRKGRALLWTRGSRLDRQKKRRERWRKLVMVILKSEGFSRSPTCRHPLRWTQPWNVNGEEKSRAGATTSTLSQVEDGFTGEDREGDTDDGELSIDGDEEEMRLKDAKKYRKTTESEKHTCKNL